MRLQEVLFNTGQMHFAYSIFLNHITIMSKENSFQLTSSPVIFKEKDFYLAKLHLYFSLPY